MQNTVSNSPYSPNQTPDTPEALDILTRAMPRRKIDATCIAEMAKLVAKMLTESEACRRLGIKPRTWFDWKSRCGRDEKFSAMLEAYRARRFEGLIERIEASAEGTGGVKYPDWRAALALLKIGDQKRFGDSPLLVEMNVRQPLLSDADMQRILGRMYKENPELEADGLFNDVRLGYRKRESLEWIQTPGQPPKRTKIRPEVKELLLAKLNAIDVPATVSALPEKCESANESKP
jgi:hypothetical protein